MVFYRVITENPPNIGVKVDALTGESIGQAGMYVRCNFPVPREPPEGFDLVIPGRPIRFVTPAKFSAYQTVNIDMVLECAGNGRSFMDPVPDGTRWDLDGVSPVSVGGIRLCDFLGELPEETSEVVFTGADRGGVPEGVVPYQFSISREMAMSRIPILATHLGGEPLTMKHGAPIRLMVPGQYAMKSVKWLTRVEAVSSPFMGHFVKKYRYYGDKNHDEAAPVADIAIRSIISSPTDGDTIPGGLEVKGSAWAGPAGVDKVEVSIDDGESWHETDLVRREVGGRWAPRRWAITFEVDPGSVEIIARATDSEGVCQSMEPVWNLNGYANNVVHRVKVNVS